MEDPQEPAKKSLSISPHLLVLLPFYFACILLLGANLFQDRCCREVKEQIQHIDRQTQSVGTSLRQIQNRLAGLEVKPAIQVAVPAKLPDLVEILKELGLGTLSELLADQISSRFKEKEQPVVRQEIRNQIFYFFEQNLGRGNRELAIYFDPGSAAISPSSRQLIENFREILRQHPPEKIVISGFADRVGRPERNRKLAMNRSQAVASLLGRLPTEIVETEGEDHLPIFTDDDVSEPRNRIAIIRW
ncbi:MAG: hypothetical protein QOH06_5057 [Acidobacteriota bacterium]|jgi:outer membrane protein OmpA-like peptidoglycan-associated protein|nr:hypothetical protein [Acidobacteriota bacterium]